MKTIPIAVACLAATVITAHAQTETSEASPVAGVSTATPQIVEAGANYNLWQWQTVRQLTNGLAITNTSGYTELGSGLNVQNAATGQWVPARDTIEVYAGGAVARQGQNQIIFASNLNSPGAVDQKTPEGLRLRSNLEGLMYVDPTTGQAVQIAEIQDSQGELIATNQILYPDAFNGLDGDVLYLNRRDGMEQDVVIRSQPPAPESFGMNSGTTFLEVFTEFLTPPAASVADVANEPQDPEPDQAISWGATSLGKGKAFSLNGQDTPAAVTKRYVTVNGRYFLLERVKLQDIQPALSQLPLQASNARRLPGMASTHFQFPKGPQAKSAARPVRLAMGARPKTGYVLDYVSLTSAYTNYIFQGGNTYYVSSALNLSGSNVYEGGTVIKFATNASIAGTSGSQMVFRSAPYRPVIFTAKDDNTVGQIIGGSTANPTGYYANPALNLSSLGSLALSEFRIAYANRALSVSGASPALYDAQFVNCATAISDLNGAVTVENALFSNIQTNFNATSAANTVSVQNATFNNSFDLVNGSFGSTAFYLTNCAFVNATNLSGTIAAGYNGFYQSPPVGSSAVTTTAYPLRRVGAGSCYLTNGSAFAAAGTTNVDPVDIIQLASRTTHAPVVYSNTTLTVVTTLSPQALRDTNASPDLGYHYDPLDYVFGAGVISRSNITFTAGTTVGWFYSSALSVINGSMATFSGTATARCAWAWYDTVQESCDGLWAMPTSSPGLTGQAGNGRNPSLTAGFTTFATMANEGGPFADSASGSPFNAYVTDCEFYNGGGSYGSAWEETSIYATNCLFVNGAPAVINGPFATIPMNLTMVNCTCFRGMVYGQNQDYLSGGYLPWMVTIVNCAFDQTTFSLNSEGGPIVLYYADYNSCLQYSNTPPYSGAHEITVTNAYNWQSSWFGNYYLPPNSPLIDKGSTTANLLGLYHFTTQTNQMPETNSIVDIGYHYVATDAYGNPLDTDGDGVPDYLEDSNGNGIYDAADLSDWLVSPYNGLSRTNGLSVFTPLK